MYQWKLEAFAGSYLKNVVQSQTEMFAMSVDQNSSVNKPLRSFKIHSFQALNSITWESSSSCILQTSMAQPTKGKPLMLTVVYAVTDAWEKVSILKFNVILLNWLVSADRVELRFEKNTHSS